MKSCSLSNRFIAAALVFSFTTTILLQGKAFASHQGSSTASAGTAAPPAATAIQSFQPDLFTGRATLGIPIAVPPGRRGLQPSLSLGYSSSGANGVCGVGWSIALAHIERSTKEGVPQYDGSDIFQLSFQGVSSDLVSIGSDQYRAKDEQLFLKIQFNGSDEWTVWDKAGTRYRFEPGQTAGSGQIFSWDLAEVEDRLGNTLTCDYTQDQGAQYLSAIHYTGNSLQGDSPTNRVDFLYEPRPDLIVSHRSGTRVVMAQRLKEIQTNAQDQLARLYRLAYTQSARTSRSLLASVTQIGSDGVTSLPATRFTYQSDTDPAYSICSNTAFQGRAAWNVRQANIDTGDNNDLPCHPYLNVPWGAPVIVDSFYNFGRQSVTVSPNGSVQINGAKDHFVHAYTSVYVASARTLTFTRWGSWDVACLWVQDSSGLRNYGFNVASVNLNAGWSIIHLSGYHQHSGFSLGFSNSLKAQVDLINPTPFLKPSLAGDFNGDAFADLASFEPATGIWEVAAAQICTARPETIWMSGFGGSNDTPLLGDWNGDGLTDVALYQSNGVWRFAPSTGSGFSPGGIGNASGPTGTPLVGDFNGDGLTDLSVFEKGPGNWSVALGTEGGSPFKPFTSWMSGWGAGAEPITGDFDGDGLTDVGTVQGNAVHVAFSIGTTFVSSPVVWFNGSLPNRTTADINGDGRTDLVSYDQPSGKVRCAFSTGENFAPLVTLPLTFSLRQPDDQLQVGDFNGDGLSDPAVFKTVSGDAEMALSNGTAPDLLSGVINPLGGTTSLVYQHSTQVGNQFLPFVVPVVSTVTVADGLGWSAQTSYLYENGLYDTASKEFRGFGKVTVIDPEANSAITRFHQDEHKKGRPFEQESQDDHGKLLTKTLSTWGCDESTPGVHFCFIESQEAFTYDGDATFKQTRTYFEYDSYGNLTRTGDEGELSVTGDERTTEITYTYNTSDWIVAKPAETQLKDAGGQVVSQRSFFYDDHSEITDPPTNGLLTQEIQWLDLAAPISEQPTTTFTYDIYGNLEATTDPLGRTTTNTYDVATHIFLETITNHIDHTVTQQYDPRFGSITQMTDPNGQTTQFQYDALGRTTAVIDPLDSLALPGVLYEYDLTQIPSRTIKRVRERAGESALLSSYTFADGLGRTIQVRTPAEDSNKQVVTGGVRFNSRGQVESQWLPYLETFSDRYQASESTLAQSSYVYDALGRLIETTDLDGSIWTTQYQDWTLTRTDAKGNTTIRESDAYGRLAMVTEHNGTATYTTRYTYDAQGNLTQVTDDAGNVTDIQYDLLNRKVEMDDPDMGHWTYAYDLVGNLIKQTDTLGQELTFTYDDLNRLTIKRGLSPPGTVPVTLATYRYGELGHGFGVGRPTSITDQAGDSSFTYDELGRQIQEDRTIDSITYTVMRDYDLLNRLTRLIYPDGEEVTYTYNPQGLIEQIEGQSPAGTVPYMTDAAYNAAGQLIQLTYGNGVTTDYSYDPKTLRIENIKTTGSSGTLQNLTYQFDPVGNLTELKDWVNTATQSFVYDDLNRLTQATGAYGIHGYSYDSLGNLTSKAGAILEYGQTDGTQPHAATYCEIPGLEPMTLNYDLNGSMTEKGRHRFSYDIENRLTEVFRNDPVEGAVTYTLEPGWNLITVPFDVEDQPVTDVLAGLTFGPDYDQLVTRGLSPQGTVPETVWLSYVNDDRFNQFDTFEPGRAHEIYVTQSSGITFDLTGKAPIRRPTLSLELGWNLIPSPVLEETPVTEALEGLTSGSDYDEVIRYNASTKGWEAVSVCKPGEAYWIYSLVTKPWVVPFPVSEVTTQMVYDGDGGRVKLITPDATTTFLGELFEITGSESTKHIFMGPMRLSSVTTDSTQVASLSPSPLWGEGQGEGRLYASDSVIARARSARSNLYAAAKRFFKHVEEFFVGPAYADALGVTTTFFHPDHLGSTNLITDIAGQQVELAEYTPFGSFSRKEVAQTTSNQQPATSNYYTGQRFDDTTQLYYYHARYYDPQIGRFTQADTIVQAPSDPQSLNRYTYTRNNPLKYTDPTGHSFWKKLGRILRQWVAPIAAVIATMIAGPLVGAAVYNYYSVTGANLERGRGYFESVGRGTLAGGATLLGGTVGGGAASARLSGQDPGRGALMGLVQGATAAAGGALGTPANDFVAVAQAAAIGAASGAAGAAIVGGDPLKGAAYGAAAAAAVTAAVRIGSALMRSGRFQEAVDAKRTQPGSKDPILADPRVKLEMEIAWRDSSPWSLFGRHEEGGWIVRNGNSLTVQRWKSGGRTWINATPQPKNAVGAFHTHPNPPVDLFGIYKQGPSGGDIRAARHSGVPEYVISRDNIYRVNPF